MAAAKPLRGVKLQASKSGDGNLGHVLAIILAVAVAFKSNALGGALLVLAALDKLAALMTHNLLFPNFLVNTLPEEGLSEDPEKMCPYWPLATVKGPAAMGLSFEDVAFPSLDGCTLRGWLFRPTKVDRKCLLLMSHGAARDRRAWLRHCPFLLDAGYTCMTFDFHSHGTSGSCGRGGTSLGLIESEDVRAAVRWATATFPAMHIALVGTSTGAVSSLVATATDEAGHQMVQCVVAENPFMSIRALASFVLDNVGFRTLICRRNTFLFTLLLPVRLITRILCLAKVSSRLRHLSGAPSAEEAIARVRVPVLIMHGTDDQIVPHWHSEKLALASCVKSRWFCQRAGHCQLWDTDRTQFETTVLEFLAAHVQ